MRCFRGLFSCFPPLFFSLPHVSNRWKNSLFRERIVNGFRSLRAYFPQKKTPEQAQQAVQVYQKRVIVSSGSSEQPFVTEPPEDDDNNNVLISPFAQESPLFRILTSQLDVISILRQGGDSSKLALTFKDWDGQTHKCYPGPTHPMAHRFKDSLFQYSHIFEQIVDMLPSQRAIEIGDCDTEYEIISPQEALRESLEYSLSCRAALSLDPRTLTLPGGKKYGHITLDCTLRTRLHK